MANCNPCGDEKFTSKLDASCVIYRPDLSLSDLACLDANSGDSVQYILEQLAKKLCGYGQVPLKECVREKLEVASDVEVVSQEDFFQLLQDYICNSADRLVKASPTDAISGYLIDKLDVDPCIIKSIKKDGATGVEKVSLRLDYGCIAANISTCLNVEASNCITVDCTTCQGQDCVPQPLVPVIVRNGTTLTGSNCNGSLQWYNATGIIVGAGPSVTVQPNGDYYAKCTNSCGESNKSNTVNVPAQTTYTKVRQAYFTRNNCGTNSCSVPCVGTSNLFSRTYTSTVSQDAANALAENDTSFALDGQAQANLLGTCTCSDCNCVFPTYNSNVSVSNPTCNGSIIQANGQILIVGINNADKFGYSFGAGDYSGVPYSSAITLSNFNQGNVETTPTTIKLKSLSIETRVVFRIFNAANTCFRDVVVTLSPPDCTQEQVSVGTITVACEVEDLPCLNWSVVANAQIANVYYQPCSASAPIFYTVQANTTAQLCSRYEPQASGGAAVTQNGNC